uniref:Reverse transcriptase Ty1/copia-type domain-containing protein n=1 Tax=Chromera velia CCMP2878 TaxID=1169474 RepID=A0A0G4H5K9_9ALVE|eukprot:Cvel_24770.t1-p1 / transcript=Cvel_24770.t1 / gene=Cvel_24770 / organism=Chromera_velia_CCMP2878 / gene_product=hypothetical protein / transcript_product=hypothetical protein / location=Cvel_scaffold2723:6843-7691(+) / protein_length=206 / sequence_SO=supercontig / SO=protein_coding / is_pseudo=false
MYEEEMSRFKKGSTQLPVTKEEIDSRSHKLAAVKVWLVNILAISNRMLGRRVKRNEVRAVVGIGWRCTWKKMEDGGRKPKVRFFAKGFLDGRLIDTYVGTPSIAGINTVCLFIVSIDIQMGAADITAAFLTSKDHNAKRVGATLPSVLPRVPDENPVKDIYSRPLVGRRILFPPPILSVDGLEWCVYDHEGGNEAMRTFVSSSSKR